MKNEKKKKQESEIGGGRWRRRKQQEGEDTVGFGILWFVMQPKTYNGNEPHTRFNYAYE